MHVCKQETLISTPAQLDTLTSAVMADNDILKTGTAHKGRTKGGGFQMESQLLSSPYLWRFNARQAASHALMRLEFHSVLNRSCELTALNELEHNNQHTHARTHADTQSGKEANKKRAVSAAVAQTFHLNTTRSNTIQRSETHSSSSASQGGLRSAQENQQSVHKGELLAQCLLL